ncbi:MAG: response regulator [Saccharospirillum sp.]|uniref:response regulator n=1 Tax=Saccharospirillum sp. TaxID=2033801 RepID=UPI00329892B1
MNILIVEDDPLMRELLLTIVGSIRNSLSLHEAEDADSAWSLWRTKPMDLVLCDWNLLGSDTGLDLARRIRQQNDTVPIVMVTGRGDRQSVIASHRAGLNGYIVKPFTPEDVMERLTPFFKPASGHSAVEPSDTPTDWVAWLEAQAQQLDRLTLLPDAQEVLSLQWQDELPTAKLLAKRWQDDVIITSRLLSVANSSEMRRYGRSVLTLLDAIATMGVAMAIAQVSALLLNQGSADRPPTIKNRMQRYSEESQRVAEAAAKLAARLKLDPAPYYTAGLLSRLGEFAVLDVIEQHPNPTSEPDDAMLDQLVTQFGSRYGNAVKINWQLPLPMREFIGAIHHLPSDAVRRDLLLMHLAGMQTRPQPEANKMLRLQRALGLDLQV